MKGIIFNITEDFIAETYGDHQLEKIIKQSNLITKEPFVSPGTYPDEDLIELVSKTSELLEVDSRKLLVDLGRYSFSQLASRHSNFLNGYNNPKKFLLTIENVVHVEVKKLYSDAYLPTFRYKEPSENELVITYYSKRKLYPLMEGLIDGVSKYFNTRIDQKHLIYEREGIEYCDFMLKFYKS